MIKFYTPKEWCALFDCPSLIIDDEGKIWAADNYHKILFGEPSGRIDYAGGKIYGKDLGYGMFAEPIAYLETKNGVTKVLDAKKGLFSSPMLYIQDDKVYTPEQWTSILDAPGGYIKKDNPSGDGTSDKKSSGSSRGGFSFGGEIGILAFIALFLLIGNGVEAIFNEPIWLVLVAVILATVLILRKVSGGPEIVRLKLSAISKGLGPAKIFLCKANAAICAALLFSALVVSMVLCVLRVFGTIHFALAPSLGFMLFAVMGALYWLEYLVFRNAMLLGRIGCWPMREIPAAQKENVPNSSQSQPVKQSGPVTTINHQAAPGAAPATVNKIPKPETSSTVSGKKAVPVKVKTVTVKQSNGENTHE